jgi:hypothetical protein
MSSGIGWKIGGNCSLMLWGAPGAPVSLSILLLLLLLLLQQRHPAKSYSYIDRDPDLQQI